MRTHSGAQEHELSNQYANDHRASARVQAVQLDTETKAQIPRLDIQC